MKYLVIDFLMLVIGAGITASNIVVVTCATPDQLTALAVAVHTIVGIVGGGLTGWACGSLICR